MKSCEISAENVFRVPKGPSRTKNTMTIEKIANYSVVFLLRPPYLLRHGPFLQGENVCNSMENGVRTRCAAIVNHSAVVNSQGAVKGGRQKEFGHFFLFGGGSGGVEGRSESLDPTRLKGG